MSKHNQSTNNIKDIRKKIENIIDSHLYYPNYLELRLKPYYDSVDYDEKLKIITSINEISIDDIIDNYKDKAVDYVKWLMPGGVTSKYTIIKHNKNIDDDKEDDTKLCSCNYTDIEHDPDIEYGYKCTKRGIVEDCKYGICDRFYPINICFKHLEINPMFKSTRIGLLLCKDITFSDFKFIPYNTGYPFEIDFQYEYPEYCWMICTVLKGSSAYIRDIKSDTIIVQEDL